MEADRLNEIVKAVQMEGSWEYKKAHVASIEGSRDRRAAEQSEIEVRRLCRQSHSLCGGLDDSAVEAGIIRAIMLWVPAIIRLVHILNIQWGILGRHARQKGSLAGVCAMWQQRCAHMWICVLSQGKFVSTECKNVCV